MERLPPSWADSQIDFHSVVGGGDGERRAGPRGLVVAPRVGKYAVDRLIVGCGLVVEHAKMPRRGALAQIHADDIARMAPIRFHRDRLGERTHGVEDYDVGVANALDEIVDFL